jgi:SpoVK/Ycf46/Vps4 family AAA+-type ATPase
VSLFLPSKGAKVDFRSLGKGLVILLHGAPGVGKTFTAGKFP